MNFQLEHIKKGEYIFREGDSSKKFYGVIKGRISIRVRKRERIDYTNVDSNIITKQDSGRMSMSTEPNRRSFQDSDKNLNSSSKHLKCK